MKIVRNLFQDLNLHQSLIKKKEGGTFLQELREAILFQILWLREAEGREDAR